MGEIILILLIAVPFVLTFWNVFTFFSYLKNRAEKRYNKLIEVIAVVVGAFYLDLYFGVADIMPVNWDVQLNFMQTHSPLAPETFPTVIALTVLVIVGYLLIRFVPAEKQPPLLSALGMAAVYIGIVLGVVFCIQLHKEFFIVLFAANCILILMKSIFILVTQKDKLLQEGQIATKFKKLSAFLNKATNLPWFALVLAIPLLGILIVVLMLFGQAPDSIIKAWTDTADWTLSQKIPPPSVDYDGHYLCTVAAGGHRAVVRPLRTGLRHGRQIIVNRQLSVANAFEQLLEEKAPALHRRVRYFYDRTGYPIAKHIRAKWLADVIYLLMKPLEWLFLLVLYAVDVKPENRIALQYPHAAMPGE